MQATNLSARAPASAVRTDNIVEQVFVRELSGGDLAICFFNRGEEPRNMSISWDYAAVIASRNNDNFTAPIHTAAGAERQTILTQTNNELRSVRDIWKHNSHGANLGIYRGGFTGTVQPHRVLMLRTSSARATSTRSELHQR